MRVLGASESESAPGIVDAAARLRIREQLATTMVVVAGAGTGKTTELVERIVMLVSTGGAQLRDLAAITFTEAAAAELRERIRKRLADAAAQSPSDPALRAALDDVDEAAISTLHSFAQRMLLEHCAAVGLPSGFEVLDDTADACDFETRWARFANALFDDPGAEQALVKGFVTGLRHTDLRAVARALHDNWDRLEDQLGDRSHDDEEGPSGPRRKWPAIDCTAVVSDLDKALSLESWCTDDEDKLLAHLRLVVADAREQLVAAGSDEQAVLQLLASLPTLRCAFGRKENWAGRVSEVREACAAAEARRSEILESVRKAVLLDLLPRLVDFVLRAADDRRLEGKLTFHDLLVHARRLLRGGGESVRALRRRYKWILVDEFQDTDPIQVELAARLASTTEGASEIRAARPGGLFVVGDPKQSIYRFRRADIELFERVGAEIGERIVLQTNFRSVPGIIEFVNVVFEELFGSQPVPGQAEHLALRGARPAMAVVSARSSSPPDTRDPGSSGAGASWPLQLSFDQMTGETDPPDSSARRGAGADPGHATGSDAAGGRAGNGSGVPEGAPVVVLGGAFDGSVADVRREAAREVARCIRTMVEDAWQIADAAGTQTRAVCFADVALLIPTRTSLLSLEEALEEAGLPYRLEGASMLWDTEEVRDVLAVLRAADDPADRLSVLAALRSPGLGCGDDDLVSWQAGGGRWDPRSPAPGGLDDHPVARALRVIDALHRERWWREPSELLAKAVGELRSFELALAHKRPRDHWQRLRWLLDQARLFDETAGGTLRSFLEWARLQADGDRAGAGVGPPDPDDDAVRVMTIHGAKGLEFPVVVLAGLERQESDGQRAQTVLWTDEGSLEIRAGPLFRTDGYDDADRKDQELDCLERDRLLYVGMTRARDLLVLCLHHRAVSPGGADPSLASRVFAICEAHPDLWRELPRDQDAPADSRRRAASNGPSGEPVGASSIDVQDWCGLYRGWTAARAEHLARLRKRPVTSAGALAEPDFLQPGPGARSWADPGWPDEDDAHPQPSELPLRIGRAVHEVLATVDLATGRDLAGRDVSEISRARAIAHGIEGHEGSIASMAEKALVSPVVARAGARRHWRELYVGVPVDLPALDSPPASCGLLEGYVDLLFEDEDGLVVVDYKTDRLSSPSAIRAAVGTYRSQVAAYSFALEKSCARPVARCVLVFLGGGDPNEYVLEGDELAAARARTLERARAALTV